MMVRRMPRRRNGCPVGPPPINGIALRRTSCSILSRRNLASLSVGIIMTGMAKTALRASAQSKRRWHTIAQSEETCVVGGNAARRHDEGFVQKVLPLDTLERT